MLADTLRKEQSFFVPFIASFFITLAAHIRIDLFGVPFTFQTFAVLLLGSLFGARFATTSILLYLLQGFALFPFTHSLWLFSPLSGYIFGLLIAGFYVGHYVDTHPQKSFLQLLSVNLLGAASILFFGWLVLQAHIGLFKAFQIGVLPFCIYDALKALSVTFLAQAKYK